MVILTKLTDGIFHPRCHSILKYIKEHGKAHTRELEKELGYEHPYGAFYVTKLLERGLLVDGGWVKIEDTGVEGGALMGKTFFLSPDFDGVLDEAQKLIDELRCGEK